MSNLKFPNKISPVPVASKIKLSLDLDAVILLSLIVTPSVDIALLLTTKPEAALPVNNVAPDTVPVIEVLATVTLVVPDVIVDIAILETLSSTYFLFVRSPSALGADVEPPVIFNPFKSMLLVTCITPVPAGSIIILSLLLNPDIVWSSIFIASLAILVVAVKAPVTFVFVFNSIVPVPAGVTIIFSFDLVPVMLASSNSNPGN